MNEFRVAVIGAGETGTPLLKQLLESDFVTVVGVADLDLNMPGIALARARGGVKVTDDFMELAALGKDLDIIIDVTGVPKVREALRKHMVETGNDYTLIMHERIALLMMSLSAGKRVSGKHDALDYSWRNLRVQRYSRADALKEGAAGLKRYSRGWLIHHLPTKFKPVRPEPVEA